MEPEGSLPHSQVPTTFPYPLRSYQSINPGPRLLSAFHNNTRLYGELLLAPRPNPKLEDHLLSAAHDYLFNTFVGTLHVGDRSSIRSLSTGHGVVAWTHLSTGLQILTVKKCVCLYCKNLKIIYNAQMNNMKCVNAQQARIIHHYRNYINNSRNLHLFISVYSQHDAQNLFHNKFYFMPLNVSSTFAHHQEVKIALQWMNITSTWHSVFTVTNTQ